jgi:phosphonate transport system substrate-binding protein
MRAAFIPFVALSLALAVAGCSRPDAADQPAARPSSLRIGWVPNDEDVERRARWDGVRAYLERTLRMPVELVQTGTYSPAIEAMRAGKLDVCGLAPFAYLIASAHGVAEPLVAPGFGDGQPNRYRSGFIVPAASALRSMDDVKAKAGSLTLAWADPASASGHLVPRAYLESLGLNPERDFKQTMFSMSHTSSIMTAKAGKVDLAAITTTSLHNMIEKGRIAEGDVRVLWESEPIMASIIAVRRDLPADFKSELLAAYLAFPSADPAAWALIEPLYLSPGIRWVAASDRDFDSLRALARGVKHLDLIP